MIIHTKDDLINRKTRVKELIYIVLLCVINVMLTYKFLSVHYENIELKDSLRECTDIVSKMFDTSPPNSYDTEHNNEIEL
jgi:hypothetical protein